MTYIMNRDLFPTPKDAEIAHLKQTIKKFKEYDKERTRDYHRVCEELEWYKEEYDSIADNDKKACKIKNQRKVILQLQNVIDMNKYKDDFPLEDVDKFKLMRDVAAAKMKLSQKDAEVKRLKEDISILITKLQQQP